MTEWSSCFCDSKKIATTKDVPANQHLVVTDCNITKSNPEDFSEDDIEMIVAAIWEGVGRKEVSNVRSQDDLKCGYGCGCGSVCQ